MARFVGDSVGNIFDTLGKVKAQAGARMGKIISGATTKGPPASSGRMASAMHGIRGTGGKMLSYSKQHPFKATGMGAMGLGAASYISGRTRRGPGTSRVAGRSTGMYKY